MSDDANIYEDMHKKEIEEAKKALKRDDTRRKILYSDAEGKLLLEDVKISSLKLFIGIVSKYNISSDDVESLLEIAPNLI